ncbi:MAG TPA: hypothetical protein VHN80_10225 [Kineosporiaceae bacterium]|jgi:hypothetical protein|nr:hypothetical protein [Kineosporiaceae bacterium]
MGFAAQAYRSGRPRVPRVLRVLRVLAEAFTAAGVAGAALSGVVRPGRGVRALAAGSGLALLAGSVCTRSAVFEAGRATTEDPRYVVEPQRARLAHPSSPA